MKIKPRVAYALCLPSDIVPEDAQVSPGNVSVPSGLLPCVIVRADDPHKIGEKTAALFEWFNDNMEPSGGYIPGTAALPALSLNKELWPDVLEILERALSQYEKVVGPVFVPALNCTRDSLFAVADLYTRMLHGTTMTPVVTYSVPKSEAIQNSGTAIPDIDDSRTMLNNHVPMEAPAVKETDSAD